MAVPSVTLDATTSTTPFNPVGVDVVSPLLGVLRNNETVALLLTFQGVLNVLNILWTTYAILAYLVAIGMLYLFVYASVRIAQLEALEESIYRDAELLYDQTHRGAPGASRLDDVLKHSTSENPNDWKLAIIEADIILDDILKQRGFVGSTLGERLRNITPNQLASIDEAWEAHKVRNRIAHDGTDFVLTKRLAEDTIKRYRTVFREFGIT